MNEFDPKQMLQKIQADCVEMAKDPISFQFNRCLKRAETLRSPLQRGIVKNNFVRSAFNDVMQVCVAKLNNFNVDQTNPVISLMVFDEARMVEAIYQFHLFYTGHLTDEKRVELQSSIEYKKKLIDEISGFLTAGTMFETRMPAPTAPLSPEIWAYSIVCDRFLLIHTSFNREPAEFENIAIKLMQDAFSSIKGTIQLLSTGQNSCAVTLWRHLHEIECISLILTKYGKDSIFAYYQHQRYAEMEDDNPIFVEAMKSCKAKIGNNKNGFRNYGWLLSIPDFINNWDLNAYCLDMRSGLQKFAQLSEKEVSYITASKILHPTALMLSITPEKYYTVTMELLYDTTMNIIDAYGSFICKSNLLSQQEYLNFRTSVEKDTTRLNENIEIIRQKRPQS